jgi:hypothetical protein
MKRSLSHGDLVHPLKCFYFTGPSTSLQTPTP